MRVAACSNLCEQAMCVSPSRVSAATLMLAALPAGPALTVLSVIAHPLPQELGPLIGTANPDLSPSRAPNACAPEPDCTLHRAS